MASLDHENIVKVYDISQDGEVPFIVAECVEGRDVGSMLKSSANGRLDEQFTRKVVEQLLRALDYAHRRGVIHRDIKPSNVLITQDGVVKVADFGIARVVEEEVGDPSEIIGSARYMSPEQLRGEETTPRSDLYSVGVLLYHCLTGRPPFSGATSSVARQQIHKDPTPPRELNKAIPPRLEAVILKALAKDPEDRYPSALAMLESLRKNSSVKDSDKAARKPSKGRKALLAFSMLALLFLGGGTAAAGLGYVDLQDLPLSQRAEETALAPAQPAEEEPPPPVVVPEEEAPQETEQNTAPEEEDLEAVALVPVPNVDAYFDYFAEETLANSGFRTEVVRDYREGYAPTGVTWGTDPVVGTLMPVGSTVIIYATPRDLPQIPQPQIQPQVPQPQIQPQPQVPQPQVPQPQVLQPQIPG